MFRFKTKLSLKTHVSYKVVAGGFNARNFNYAIANLGKICVEKQVNNRLLLHNVVNRDLLSMRLN